MKHRLGSVWGSMQGRGCKQYEEPPNLCFQSPQASNKTPLRPCSTSLFFADVVGDRNKRDSSAFRRQRQTCAAGQLDSFALRSIGELR